MPATGEQLLDRLVGTDDAGGRLDVVIAGWLQESRSHTAARIAAGEVTVAGAPMAKGHRVRVGERITVRETVPGTAAAPAPVPVRYVDTHLLVVAKPAGLVVHPGSGRPGLGHGGEPTLVDALDAMGYGLAETEDPARPGVVHRLDRGTSGLLVLARTSESLARLQSAFAERAVERTYYGLVQGLPDPPRATVEAAIGRDPGQRTRFATRADGRPAVTHYDVHEALGSAAAITARLETGRTHQVRVHMAATGHPLVGDRQYGADRRLADSLGLARPALHARRLGFAHPEDGRWLAFTEAAPADLTEALTTLRASGAQR
jgi:23S rRNA pseudouridine1911/1915/1917 synthase